MSPPTVGIDRLSWLDLLSGPAKAAQNIPLAPFRDRLALRRQRYVPLGDRTPLQALAPLFAGGALETVAAGQWPQPMASQKQPPKQSQKQPQQQNGAEAQYWAVARFADLEIEAGMASNGDTGDGTRNGSGDATGQSAGQSAGQSKQTALASQLIPYLHIDLTQDGGISLRLLTACRCSGTELALSTMDGVGQAFNLAAQASFIQRLAQCQEMQLEIRQEFAIRRSLYQALSLSPLRPSQALRYFDRLLDESPYPPSRTPASDRLLQRRQLLQNFSAAPAPSLWAAYTAVAQWVNHAAPGSPAQRWLSCCHGPGATMLRQALAYAVALQYDQRDLAEASPSQRPSGAQRSLAASDALQARVQQLRQDNGNQAIAQR